MKHIASVVVIFIGSITACFATVHTLCNMPYSPGQHTTFSAAHAAAAAGDTIYVHGSHFNYGNISVNKPLVIIGTGHNPDKQSPLVSLFETITVSSSNVQLIGLSFARLGSSFTSNVQVKKCKFSR
ncbi:MAG TPA: hypothetical protein VK508_15625 [Cyclobacteriaceae bacterium]|nr:hypothetical protein [Cyclobacteriaceae bacterium]